MTSNPSDPRPHVIVVGGGFGGVQAVKSLKRADVRITLIDKRNFHLFQPLLYQVATTILPTSDVAWPLREIFQNRPDVTTLLAEVKGVDPAAKEIALENGKRMGYDMLILATGARHSYFGNEAWEAFAPGLKSLEDAVNIRQRILSAFEAAELSEDPTERVAHLTIAVIGAGPTGVEVAGIISELAHRVLPKEFRRIDTHKTRILLVEAGDRVLPAFPEPLSQHALRSLEKLGVEVRLGAPVTECDGTGISIGSEKILCNTILWAAGVQASPAARWLDAKADRAGRVVVLPDLSVPGHPEVFVIGDTASVTYGEMPVPGVAPAAKQAGAYVAKVIETKLKGEAAPRPFAYTDMGNLATIGRRSAVADFGRLRLRGVLAWWIWGAAHIYFLIGTRSRFAVAWNWLWAYLTGRNSSRLITQTKD